DLDRLVQTAGGKGSQGWFGMEGQLGTESAAARRRENRAPLPVDHERAGARGMGGIDDLGTDVDCELIAVRYRHTGIRLHRLGELYRRRGALIAFDTGIVEPGLEIA